MNARSKPGWRAYGMFKRNGSKNWHSKVLFKDAYYEVTWKTPVKPMARKYEAMWRDLVEKRAWDVLEPVLTSRVSVGKLWDDYSTHKHSVEHIRASGKDTDLVALLPAFLSWYRASGVRSDTAAIVEAHVRWLIGYRRDPATRAWMLGSGPTMRLSSTMTPAFLTGRLSEYPGSPATRRRVHTAWSVFAQWMVSTSIISASPLASVPRPKLLEQPVKFYDLKDVLRIIAAAPNDDLRSLWAFMYGTGAEISPALAITKTDVGTSTRTVRVAGTKTKHRDRQARVSDWSWHLVDAAARSVDQGALLWARLDRWRASKVHREVVSGLGLPAYPLYNARHHWAATRLRAGWPLAMVQAQLGHSRPTTTLNVYGRFMPTAGDFDRWEASMIKPPILEGLSP